MTRAAGYRKKKDSDTWHFCRNCSNWPTSNFDTSASRPSGELCSQRTRGCIMARRGETHVP